MANFGPGFGKNGIDKLDSVPGPKVHKRSLDAVQLGIGFGPLGTVKLGAEQNTEKEIYRYE